MVDHVLADSVFWFDMVWNGLNTSPVLEVDHTRQDYAASTKSRTTNIGGPNKLYGVLTDKD